MYFTRVPPDKIKRSRAEKSQSEPEVPRYAYVLRPRRRGLRLKAYGP